MKVLIVSVPSIGHVRSMGPVAKVLVRRGHEVHWAANESVGYVRETGAALTSVLADDLTEDRLDWTGSTAAEVDQWLIEHWFIPIAEQALPRTVEVARQVDPDLIVSDSTALWGGMVAELLDRPVATYCPGLFMSSPERQAVIREIQWPQKPFVWTEETALVPTYWQMERRLNALRRTVGLPADTNLDRVSDSLVLCFTTRAVEFDGAGLPPQARCVGPVFCSPDDVDPFAGRAATVPQGTDPLVYVTLGNVYARSPGLFETIVDALAGLGVRVFVAGANGAVTADRRGVVAAEGPVSQPELLEQASVVVGSGGFNTVNESLCHGVPVVALPVAGDEPALARRIEELGLGLALDGEARTPRSVRESVREALLHDDLRRGAGEFSFEAKISNGVSTAVRLLEELGREGTVAAAPEHGLLERLPELPRFAPRFRLDERSGQVVLRSHLEELALDGERMAPAVRWLWDTADGTVPLADLLDRWTGDGNLLPIIDHLTAKGVLEDTVGSTRLADDARTRYEEQITLFSHAYAGAPAPHVTLRGNEFQERLLAARVCVLGSGVLASNVVRDLCLVGVGRLRIVADGTVDEGLIARGGWYRDDEVGAPTRAALANHATRLRPDIAAEPYELAEITSDAAAAAAVADVHLVILAEDAFDAGTYSHVDRACQREKVQWTSIRRLGMEVEIGPTVVPRQTPCFYCYEQRRAGNERGGRVLDGTPAAWFHVAAGSECVVLEAVKLLTGFGEAMSLGRVIVFDPLGMTLSHHRVLRLPDCPRCSGGTDVPPEIHWRPLA
jgi:bacteriocin biosynthesis cyclodehydratase domain-containing protein